MVAPGCPTQEVVGIIPMITADNELVPLKSPPLGPDYTPSGNRPIPPTPTPYLWNQTGSDIIPHSEPQKRAVHILLECFLVVNIFVTEFSGNLFGKTQLLAAKIFFLVLLTSLISFYV